jgi:predicted small lipoprotein YifL
MAILVLEAVRAIDGLPAAPGMGQSAAAMKTKILGPVLLFAALLLPACGSRVPLYAPQATLASVVQVRTFEAFAHGDRIFVKTVITNISGQPIVIDRDGFALKLPGGEVLPRSSGTTTQHKPYMLAPGEPHEVFVDFRAAHDLDRVPSALLVVGGITVGAEPMPRVVGEIPLSQAPMAPPPPPQ